MVPAGVLLLSGCFMQFLRPLLMQQILLVVENDPDNPPVIAREYSPLCTPNMYPHFTPNSPVMYPQHTPIHPNVPYFHP